MAKTDLTVDIVRARLHYEPLSGDFVWVQPNLGAKIGEKAGSVRFGYTRITLFKSAYAAHRLAWLYVYGIWPDDQLDHINGNRSDNRIVNLRECSHAQNLQNRSIGRNNKSGFLGVYQEPTTKKWKACIKKDGRKLHLGTFETPELASSAYKMAKSQLHTFQPTLR